jgi:hypothetical protein
MNDLLNALIAEVPPKRIDPSKEYADLMENGGDVDAEFDTIKVEFDDGERRIHFPGGLTEKHYAYFGPMMSDEQKAPLALGVLQNMLRDGSEENPIPPLEWLAVRNSMHEKYGFPESDWLPALVEDQGFEAVAHEFRQALDKQRKNPQVQLDVVLRPRIKWNPGAGILTCLHYTWPCRRRHGPTSRLLGALQTQGWPPCVQMTEDVESLRDAVSALRKKTKGVIKWKISNDSTVSWWSVLRPGDK